MKQKSFLENFKIFVSVNRGELKKLSFDCKLYCILKRKQEHNNTRMHSSRMRTTGALTIRGCLPRRPSVWEVSARGLSAQEGDVCPGGGVCPEGGCLPRRGCLQRWVFAVGCLLGGCLPEGCHVTYPIMNLILAVCCPNTN